MGVEITDAENVVLFDGTTGLAFGPVFKSESEAQDFLDWLAEQDKKKATFEFGYDTIIFYSDSRGYRQSELIEIKRIFDATREDNVQSVGNTG